MNKIARKLVLSILTVVLTVIALGTTTFAWFTLTNTAQVQQFQAQIVADTGIEIAIGNPNAAEPNLGLNWVTTLTTAAVNQYIYDEYANNFRFQHVTSSDGRTFRTLGLDPNTGLPITSNTAAPGSVLVLPLHFRSATSNQIFWTGATLSSAQFNWLVNQTFTNIDGTVVTAGSQIPIDASNAMRMSITGNVGGVTSTVAYEKAASEVNILGQSGDLRGDIVGQIENPLYDPEDTEPDAEPEFLDVYAGVDGAMNYYFSSTSTLPGGVENVVLKSTLTSMVSEPKILDMTENVENSGQLYYGMVNVRIWIEGWDANAYNSILDRVINASLVFRGNE